MPHDELQFDSGELVFEEIRHAENQCKRIGRLKATGITVIESIIDEHRREVQKSYFDDQGQMTKRVVYEYDEERKPRFTTVFDERGNVVMRQERGKRPVISG
jgi:hypothetical protein